MKILFILGFYLFSQPVFCQTAKLPPDSPKKLNTTKYSLKSRLNFYPFNSSTQIRVVSFNSPIDSSNVLKSSDITYKLPISNDTICFSKLNQAKKLTLNQVDTLSDILYNTCARWTIYDTNEALCYLPHNAIIFFDQNDKVLGYIEICFDCNRIVYSNEKIRRFEKCDHAISDLKAFFKGMGLKTSREEFETTKSQRLTH